MNDPEFCVKKIFSSSDENIAAHDCRFEGELYKHFMRAELQWRHKNVTG